MIGTIQKWGNSNAIRLPKTLLDELNLRENEQVEITADKESIIIRKCEPKYSSLDDIFVNYDGDYKCEEYDWGKPMGKEVW